MRDTREIQTEPVRGREKSEAGVALRRDQFQPVPVAELAEVVGGNGYIEDEDARMRYAMRPLACYPSENNMSTVDGPVYSDGTA